MRVVLTSPLECEWLRRGVPDSRAILAHGFRGAANTAPARLQESALIMVDLPNTCREDVMRLKGVEEALMQARRVLDRARELGRPVIHIRHDAGIPPDARSGL